MSALTSTQSRSRSAAVLSTLEEKAAYRFCRWRLGLANTWPVIPSAGCRCWSMTVFALRDPGDPALSRSRVAAATLTPTDETRRADDQAMNINDWYLFQGVGNVIIFHRVIARSWACSDEAAIKAAMPKARLVFDELQRRRPAFSRARGLRRRSDAGARRRIFTIIPNGSSARRMPIWWRGCSAWERPSMGRPLRGAFRTRKGGVATRG